MRSFHAGDAGPGEAPGAGRRPGDGAAPEALPRRRLPIGAEVVPGGVHFRVWAPGRRRVEVVVEGGEAAALTAEAAAPGYASGRIAGLGPGARYRVRLDGEGPYPDPASRFQPEGPHGPSEVVDPGAYRWQDGGWPGLDLRGQVLYELHVGTFTPEGTYAAAGERLAHLARTGITAIELMPVADFPGRFGWGYDGVDLFAPTRLYGRPDDLRRLVDRAHGLGLGVLLDVVYNHFGPEGNYLGAFARAYQSERAHTDWGAGFNFDGPDAGPVREFVLANARYWIDEFHLDGLRLDATQNICDASDAPILTAIGRAVRAAAGGRRALVIAENEPQRAALVRPVAAGGHGLDGVWSDDFHHSARVALTGRAEGYYSDYRGAPQELISAIRRGYLYQGQRSSWQRRPRGTASAGLAPEVFVHYLQNHDQVANALHGLRGHQLGDPAAFRALTALLLLGPQTPLLFQGQEFAASSPFLFFADLEPGLRRPVARGRRQFLAQFPSLAAADAQAAVADPGDEATFRRAVLDWRELEAHAGAWALHRDLLRLRRDDPVFRAQGAGGVDGAVLGPAALALRFFGAGEGDGDRLLIVNLGGDLRLAPAPEPLLAPAAADGRWRPLWSSEAPAYGGGGAPAPDPGGVLFAPARAAIVLTSRTCPDG